MLRKLNAVCPCIIYISYFASAPIEPIQIVNFERWLGLGDSRFLTGEHTGFLEFSMQYRLPLRLEPVSPGC